MDDVALANYIAGIHFGNVSAGHADRLLAGLLGVAPGTPIWLSDYTLIKLHDKHGYINFSHYRHMPSILLHGSVAQGRKSRLVELWWLDKPGAEADGYQVVLKATHRAEIFITTFHLREARRLRRSATNHGKLVRLQEGFDTLAELSGR